MSINTKIISSIILVILLSLCSSAALAQATVNYTVNLENAQTQTVEITIEITDVSTPTLDLILPTWRPGRYVILDPAGTLRTINAVDATSPNYTKLQINKINKNTWRIQTNGAKKIRTTYTIYANSLNDRTRHVDDSHAFLSGSSVFLYNPERRSNPLTVNFKMPDDWKIATGLDINQSNNSVTAPNYDVLVDSPLELGIHETINFDVLDTPHEIVIWPTGINYNTEQLIEDFTTIIEASHNVFDSFPYQRYVFLIHAGAGAGGGTEHLNSTIMQSSRGSLEGSIDNNDTYKRFLGLVAHEFFHTWNVKSFRPAGISPYDYTNENYTTLFWVAEGTTSYYSDLLRVRTGHRKTKKYLSDLANSIDRSRNRPGTKIQSLADSSFDAWIKFNRSSPDDVNAEVSFYGQGALASLLLDLKIRTATDNHKSLDDVIKSLNDEFNWPGPGYTQTDLQRIIENHTAATDFTDYFTHYIEGTSEFPFEDFFATVGLELYFKFAKKDADADADDDEDEDNEDQADEIDEESTSEVDRSTPEPKIKPYLGLDLSSSGEFARVRAVRADGPAYQAGLIVNDTIIALNNRRLSASNLDTRLKEFEIDDTVTFTFMRRDELRTISLKIAGRPDGKWTIRKLKEPTEKQKSAYQSWLGQPFDG